MKNNQLLDEFTRVVRKKDYLAIQVILIKWPHPHEPKSRWHTVAKLLTNSDEISVLTEREKAICSNYFEVCERCKELKPVGWMCDENICQSCAESKNEVKF